MRIAINGITVDKWANLNMSLIHNAIGDSFSFDLYFDPNSRAMRAMFLPGNYQNCVITADNGEVMITGVVHSPSFRSSAVPHLKNISGYSRTGVLDDCEYSAVFPNGQQTDGKTLYEIVQGVADYFGLGAVQDSSNGNASKPIVTTTAQVDSKCTEYLRALCKDMNVTLSHDNKGRLVLSCVNVAQAVSYNFTDGMPGIVFDLMFNGQAMHDTITAKTQGGSFSSVTVRNPYVQQLAAQVVRGTKEVVRVSPTGEQIFEFQPTIATKFSPDRRPCSYVMTNTNTDIAMFVSSKLAEELMNITIQIEMNGWELNGKVPRPGMMITVMNPELYLFKPAKLFIRQVDFTADASEEKSVLSCVIPECFSGQDFTKITPINIFTNNGNNTTFTPPNERNPGSALQGGFAGSNNFIDL